VRVLIARPRRTRHAPSVPPTLLLVDVQRAFDEPGWGPRNNPGAEPAISRLLGAWRDREAPLVHVRHVSRHPASLFRAGTRAVEFKPEALPAPGEDVIEKSVNSAFIGTDLAHRLQARDCAALVIAGFTTDHCVSTTARMAANLGFATTVVADATATFDRVAPDGELFPAELMHRTALASLRGEFADIATADEAIALLAAV
jgi:nicotinamidase-related amidase